MPSGSRRSSRPVGQKTRRLLRSSLALTPPRRLSPASVDVLLTTPVCAFWETTSGQIASTSIALRRYDCWVIPVTLTAAMGPTNRVMPLLSKLLQLSCWFEREPGLPSDVIATAPCAAHRLLWRSCFHSKGGRPTVPSSCTSASAAYLATFAKTPPPQVTNTR